MTPDKRNGPMQGAESVKDSLSGVVDDQGIASANGGATDTRPPGRSRHHIAEAALWAAAAPITPTRQTGRDTCRRVLIALAAYADAARMAWPSQRTLAADTGLARRAVRDALVALEACGLIVRAGTARRATRYRLSLEPARSSADDGRTYPPDRSRRRRAYPPDSATDRAGTTRPIDGDAETIGGPRLGRESRATGQGRPALKKEDIYNPPTPREAHVAASLRSGGGEENLETAARAGLTADGYTAAEAAAYAPRLAALAAADPETHAPAGRLRTPAAAPWRAALIGRVRDADRAAAEQAAAIRAVMPECVHGTPGGDVPRPGGTGPACALCRHEWGRNAAAEPELVTA